MNINDNQLKNPYLFGKPIYEKEKLLHYTYIMGLLAQEILDAQTENVPNYQRK